MGMGHSRRWGAEAEEFHSCGVRQRSLRHNRQSATISNVVPLEKVAKAAGYVNAERVREREDLVYEFKDMLKKDGPSMLLVKVNEMVEDAGRVMLDPPDITKRFMQAIQ